MAAPGSRIPWRRAVAAPLAATRATPTTRRCLGSAAASRSRVILTAPAPNNTTKNTLRPVPARPAAAATSRAPRLGGCRWSSDAAKESEIWSFEEMRARPAETTVIDVREPGEVRSTGRIPGAVNIPITTAPDAFHVGADEFVDRFDFARPPPDRPVVFYCKAGVRSRAAAALARDAGWSRVAEYPGSWLDWTARGGDIEH